MIGFTENRLFGGNAPGTQLGFTLLEILTLITLLALVFSLVLRPLSSLADGMAVRGAREAAVGAFHRVRVEAMAAGGARIRLVSSSAQVSLLSRGVVRASLNLRDEFGVEMALSGGREEVELRFDALGIGRVASQSIRFSKGKARSGLVVSTLGRITRW